MPTLVVWTSTYVGSQDRTVHRNCWLGKDGGGGGKALTRAGIEAVKDSVRSFNKMRGVLGVRFRWFTIRCKDHLSQEKLKVKEIACDVVFAYTGTGLAQF